MSASVSVVIPVFNGARFVAEAIGTVLGQTVAPREVIVVDDGSADGTPDVLARFGSAIAVIRQDNAGPASARNRGIERATGDYIAFLDADDLWTPRALEAHLAALQSTGNANVAWGMSERAPHAYSTQVLDWRGRPQWALTMGAMMFKRNAFGERLRFTETIRDGGEDFDLMLRLYESGVVLEKHATVVQIVRLHGENAFSLDPVKMRTAHFAAIGRAFARQRRNKDVVQ